MAKNVKPMNHKKEMKSHFSQIAICRLGRRKFRGANLFHVIHKSPSFLGCKEEKIMKMRFFRERKK